MPHRNICLHFISKKDAESIGIKSYFTGKPCRKHGHISIKKTYNTGCIECHKERVSIYNAKESTKEAKRAWENNNKEKVSEYRSTPEYKEMQREYQRGYIHKKKKESTRRHYLKTIDHQRERSKLKREANREYYKLKLAERRAKKKNATPPWSETDLIQIVYGKGTELNLEVDHVIPLQSDFVCGLHCWSNLQLLDRQSNAEKGNYIWPDMPNTKDPELLKLVEEFKSVSI